MTYQQLDHIADSVDPILTLAALAVPFLLRVRQPAFFVLRAAVALLLVEGVAKLIRMTHLVPGRFPSTHLAWALCMATVIVVAKPKAAWVLGPLCLVYAWLNVYQQYHTPFELLGAIYAVPLTVLLLLPYLKRREPAPVLDA